MKLLIATWTLLAFVGSQSGSNPTPPSAIDPSDARDAIEREFLYDGTVPYNRIDVEVSSGIASLDGKVDNLLAKERAARIARTVRGVRSVVNRITVAPATGRSDAELRTDVEAALASDPAADSYQVDVAVHEGHVVLSGLVESWKERALGEVVAKSVRGVTGLTNEIQVVYEAQRPDVEIQRDIERTLRWNTLVDHVLIDVEVDHGKVVLKGTVGSAAEKEEARLDAYAAGVESVDASGLRVDRWARDEDLRKDKYVTRSPQEVEQALGAAMAVDPRVASFNVASSVRGGVVTLRGLVDNLKAKRAAEQDARNTVGVYAVHNHLKVRPADERSNDAIAKDVRAAFLRDPYVERQEILVNVDDGVVRLSGTVDSHFERTQADDLAARVRGVTDVVNKLAVENLTYAFDPYVDSWTRSGYPHSGPIARSSFATDWQIEREIESELFWSPFVDHDRVDVRVVDGVATLSGTVDSWSEVDAARENAFEGGAVRVRNELRTEYARTLESSSE